MAAEAITNSDEKDIPPFLEAQRRQLLARAYIDQGLENKALGVLDTDTSRFADLLRAEAQAGIGSSEKAVINIHLDGGPPQMDMFDMKPNAPTEIRGEFNPIQTKLSDLQICEPMPRVATIADKFTFIRSLVGSVGAHDAFQCQTGYPKSNLKSLGGRPAMGCVISKLRGSTNDVSPSFVDMMQGRPLVRHSARPGFLGPAYKPFRPDMSKMFKRELEPGMKKELKAQGASAAALAQRVNRPIIFVARTLGRTLGQSPFRSAWPSGWPPPFSLTVSPC